MGGHGGLNILPQKRWNVYNFDNREKVRKDEEAAARDEQIKREQSRKRDTEVRLERLRTSRGLAPTIPEPEPKTEPKAEPEVEVEVKAEAGDPGHINLFEGIKIFDPIQVPKRDIEGEKEELKMKTKKLKLRKEPGESSNRSVGPEDEVYRLGYGIAGKGVQLPWYVQNKKLNDDDDVGGGVNGENSGGDRRGEKRKKTLEELREERLKRERKEKEREMALRHPKQSRREAFGSSRYYDRR